MNIYDLITIKIIIQHYAITIRKTVAIARKQNRDTQDGGIILNICCKEIRLSVIVID
jgi:hypothetical protein